MTPLNFAFLAFGAAVATVAWLVVALTVRGASHDAGRR